MSDQPTDRPPKYGGPRDRPRNAPDSARCERGEPPQRTENEPTRRTTERQESRQIGDRPQDRHFDRTHETPPPGDRLRSRGSSQPHPRNAPRRPQNRDRRDSRSRRYGETYQHSRTPSERAPPRNRQRIESRETPPRERKAPFDRSVDADLLEAFEPLEFETAAQKRVYRYVERRGIAARAEVESNLDLPVDDLTDAIRRLERKDQLEERDGTLRVAYGADVETKYEVAGSDVTIRPARQEDLADLVALIRAVTDERTYVVAESVAAQLAYEETVIRHTDTRSRTFFVAEIDADAEGASDPRLVGWAHLTLPGIEYLDHTAELTVGVNADFRRRGIGGQLMRIALAWAAANDYYKVYQSLPGTNRAAIDFLDAHGWIAEAVRRDHYRIDGEFVDEVMMAVTL